MTVRDFCLKNTQAHELVVIRDSGWIVASVWIDYEDIFLIPERVKEKEIRQESWGTLNIVTKHGDEIEVPCHYLDV
ncbi:MAG: hypothetical protein MJ246_05215 [Clostridia bacterium]|nr:hypothetical protein [Clostridia bacterium]